MDWDRDTMGYCSFTPNLCESSCYTLSFPSIERNSEGLKNRKPCRTCSLGICCRIWCYLRCLGCWVRGSSSHRGISDTKLSLSRSCCLLNLKSRDCSISEKLSWILKALSHQAYQFRTTISELFWRCRWLQVEGACAPAMHKRMQS